MVVHLASRRRSRVAPLLLGVLVAYGTPTFAAEGYLRFGAGATRALFNDQPSRGMQQKTAFRLAGGVEIAPDWALEVGLSRAAGFDPPSALAAVQPSATVKASGIDLSLVRTLAVARCCQLFVAAGPVAVSTRAEVANSRGRPTVVAKSAAISWRASAGFDVDISARLAMELAVSRTGEVGERGPALATGRSALDTISVGVITRF